MLKWIRAAAGMALLAVLGFSTCAQAAALPAVKMVNGVGIDPTTANNYYGSSTTHTAGLCGLNSILCGLPRAIPIQELSRSLSRGGSLTTAQYTQNVFEYVYRNIETEFRYGLSKGAFGALLDQSGTPFDQANLMVELLRQGGVTAGYQVGVISLTPAQFQAWTGLTNAQAICQYLANGGIPALVNGSSNCSSVSGSLTSLTMAHIWVTANNLLYDPSYKTYIQVSGINNLASVLGCGTSSAPTCGTQASAAAIPTSSQGYDGNAKANYIQNVQYAALGTKLNSFAQNLQHYIEANNATANIQDVVGGEKIDPTSAPSSGVLPYSVSQTQHSWSADIPDLYRSRLNIQFNNINTWVYADETVGYWLYIGGSNTSGTTQENVLYFERERNKIFPATPGVTVYDGSTNEVVPLVTTTATLNSNFGTVTLLADHPYAASASGGAAGSYMDDSFSKSIFVDDFFSTQSTAWKNGDSDKSPFLIIQSWGRAGRGSVQRASAMAEAKSPSGFQRSVSGSAVPSAGGDYILTTVTLPSTAAAWLAQAGQAVSINDGLAQTKTQEQHTIGVATEEIDEGSVIMQGLDAWSSASVASANGASAVQPSFAATAAAYNALEGGVVEQLNDTPDGQSAVRWFELTNETGNRFYQATPANIASIFTQTTNYGADWYGNSTQFIQSYLNAGSVFNMVVPKNGSVGTWSYSGTTDKYLFGPALAYSSDGSQLAYVITSGNKGAGATTAVNVPDPTGPFLARLNDTKPSKPLSYSVNAASGALTVAMAPDLITGTGEFPNSLTYQRFYDAGNIVGPTDCSSGGESFVGQNAIICDFPTFYRLLNGWTDNFQIHASVAGDGARALGADSGLDASSAVAALYTLQNLASSASFTNYVGQIFVASWLSDQLQYNSVIVHRPPSIDTFMHLPDGRYNPRPGTGLQVLQTGSRVKTLGPNGLYYYYENVNLVEVEMDGSRLNLSSAYSVNCGSSYYQSGNFFIPTNWSFPTGASLTFTFSGNNSSSQCADVAPTLKVTNSFGHSLTMAGDGAGANDPDGYVINTWMVTDDTGRTVHLRDKATANSNTPNSSKILLPDGSQVRANYTIVSGFSGDYADLRLQSLSVPNSPTASYVTFNWDGLSRVSSVNRVSSASSNGVTTTYFPGQVSAEQYSTGSVVDPLSNVTTTYFDKFSHPVKTVDPLSQVSTKAYDHIGQLNLDASPLLACAAYSYDVRGNVTSAKRYPVGGCTLTGSTDGQWVSLVTSSTPTPITTSSTYMEGASVWTCSNAPTCNKLASQTDGMGNTTNYSWDSTSGNLTQILKPADFYGARPEADFIYTAVGTATANVCPNSATAGGVAMLCQKTEWIAKSPNTPSSTVTSYTYNSSNDYVLQNATVDPSGLNLKTQFSFDTLGNLISVTDPKSNVSNYTWDTDRRLIFSIRPNAGSGPSPSAHITAKNTYDANGDLVQVDKGSSTDGSGSNFTVLETTAYAYDAAGNKIQAYTPNAAGMPSLTQYGYDADDRLQCTAVRMNSGQFGSLMAANFATLPTAACSLADPQDRVTELVYDAAGQKLNEFRAVGTSSEQAYATYTYTADGKQASVMDAVPSANLVLTPPSPGAAALGNMTCYTYDGFDRLSQTQFPKIDVAKGACDTSNYEQNVAYDNNDNVTTRQRRDGGQITYTYDAMNREIKRVVPAQTASSESGQPSVTLKTDYDLLDRKSKVSNTSQGGSVSWTYDLAGRRSGETTTSSGGASWALGFQYDGAGNRANMTYADGLVVYYSYDGADEFTGIGPSSTSPGTSALGVGFAYGSASSQTCPLFLVCSITRNGVSNTTALSYDNAERLATLNHNLTGAPAQWTYKYNPAAQQLNSTETVSTYDWAANVSPNSAIVPNGLNQSSAIAAVNGNSGYDKDGNLINDGSRQFVYDGENRLVSESGPVNMTLAYDPTGRLQSSNIGGVTTQFVYDGDALVAEYNGSGTLLRRYLHGPGMDQPLIWDEISSGGTSVYYLYADRQGSILAAADGSANVVAGQQYAYDPYGTPTSWTGSRFLYTGQIALPGSNLYYYKARIYDPINGRFLQTDPVGYADDDNIYAYVSGDPINRRDPTGNSSCAQFEEANPSGACWEADSTASEAYLAQSASVGRGNANQPSGSGEVNMDSLTSVNDTVVDKDKTASYMDSHARPYSLGQCAKYCRMGLEAGGLNTAGHPVAAKDYGPFLLQHGASTVPQSGYSPQKGDISVFDGSAAHPYGHIAIYDGKQWVSDFKQKNLSPYRGEAPAHSIYRFPD